MTRIPSFLALLRYAGATCPATFPWPLTPGLPARAVRFFIFDVVPPLWDGRQHVLWYLLRPPVSSAWAVPPGPTASAVSRAHACNAALTRPGVRGHTQRAQPELHAAADEPAIPPAAGRHPFELHHLPTYTQLPSPSRCYPLSLPHPRRVRRARPSLRHGETRWKATAPLHRARAGARRSQGGAACRCFLCPSNEDRDAKDQMRAAAAGADAAGGPSASTLDAPLVRVSVAPLVHPNPPVNVNGSDARPRMVQFSAPPPPPLFDPSTFRSGLLAGATRLPALPLMSGGREVLPPLHYCPPFTGVQGFAASGVGGSTRLMPSPHVDQLGSTALVSASTGGTSSLPGAQLAVNTTTQGTLEQSVAPVTPYPSVAAAPTFATVAPPSSPGPSAPARRPVTPPALKRAGSRRALGIHRRRISSVPAGSSSGSAAAASSDATATEAAMLAAMLTAACEETPPAAAAAAPPTPSTPAAAAGHASGDGQVAAAVR